MKLPTTVPPPAQQNEMGLARPPHAGASRGTFPIAGLVALLAILWSAAACSTGTRNATPGGAGAAGTLVVAVDASALGQGGAAASAGMKHGAGASAAGIKLQVQTAAGAPVATMVTDERGEAAVQLAPGDYVVTAPRGPSLPPRTIAVTVIAEQTSRTTIHLVNMAP